jgi:hypothetical protein
MSIQASSPDQDPAPVEGPRTDQKTAADQQVASTHNATVHFSISALRVVDHNNQMLFSLVQPDPLQAELDQTANTLHVEMRRPRNSIQRISENSDEMKSTEAEYTEEQVH